MGMRAYAHPSILLYVLSGWRVGIQRQNINWSDGAVSPHPNPLPVGEGKRLPIIANRLDRTAAEGFLTRGPLGFILWLLADVGIRVLERAEEVLGSKVSTDVAVDASAVDIEPARDVLSYAVVGIRHRILDFGFLICDWSFIQARVRSQRRTKSKIPNQKSKFFTGASSLRA